MQDLRIAIDWLNKRISKIKIITLWFFLAPFLLLCSSRETIGANQWQYSEVTGNQAISTVRNTVKGFQYHSSRLLVRFQPGARPEFLPNSGGVTRIEEVSGLFIVQKPSAVSIAEAIRDYRKKPNVLYAEPDYVVHLVNTTPSDPLWNKQWDMAKISTPSAWDKQTDSSNVVVAIIDTGIDYSHPDLQANLWTGGSTHGFSCFGKVTSGGVDDQGHGTHVAGTIGAVANNAIGIAGINWRVQLLSLKFLNASGSGYLSDAILCFNKAISLKQNGINIRVTNNSWGGGPYTQSLKDTMASVEAAGILNVCAAGNSGVNADSSPMYPAAYDNRGIVSVLASDQNDAAAGFSNYGLASVDIGAPGVSILSTEATGKCSLCDPSGYRYLSGTSMASPHVTGVVAALFHQNPTLTPFEARDILLNFASYDTLKDAKARTTTTGGRLNFAKAVNNPLLLSPRLNGFPTLTAGSSVTGASGSKMTLSAAVSDPDGDTLRSNWSKNVGTANTGAWLMSGMLDLLFLNGSTNPFTFTAPLVDRPVVVPYVAAVTDNRGGSAQRQTLVSITQKSTTGGVPAGSLSVTPTSGPVGTKVSITYSVSDPERGKVLWDIGASFANGWSDYCCGSGSSATVTLNAAGAYRIGVQAMDQELNVSKRLSTVVLIGGANGIPPVAQATLSTTSGRAPLTVGYNAGSSFDPDGSIKTYTIRCKNGGATTSGSSPTGSCTYDAPGVYAMNITVGDNQNLKDNVWLYVTVMP